MNDFSRTMRIECPIEEAFDALTRRIPQWWSREFEGRAETVGAEFTVRFDQTFKTMRVVQLEPCSKLTWSCVASHLDLAGLDRPSEWDGTRIEWSLRAVDGKTILTVTHAGLTPVLGCHLACEQGWDHFLTTSLVPLMEGGEGRPFESPPNDGARVVSRGSGQ